MSFRNDLRIQMSHSGALYRLLFINIGLYLLLMLTRTFLFLFQSDDYPLQLIVEKLSLPAAPAALLRQPWSLLSYMFFHWEFMHILFNMLVLYWTGRLFTEYLGGAKLWATYIMGGLAGGLFYLLAYNIFPAFANAGGTKLIGASAGVIAVLVAIATLLPDYTVQLLIFGVVRLKYIAGVTVLLYVIQIPNGNAGGELAHLGGALFGFLMVKQLRQGRDLTAWLVKAFSSKPRKVPMEVVHKNSKRHEEDAYKAKVAATQETIDRILDKINRSGFNSLTREEKDILYKASNNK